MDYLGIKHDIVGFYQKLYSSSQPDVDDIFSLVEPKVTPLMADSLNKPISREEVAKSSISTWSLKGSWTGWHVKYLLSSLLGYGGWGFY